MPPDNLKRQRARPVFREELPLRVDRTACSGMFDEFVERYSLQNLARSDVINRLEEIAHQLRHSRALAAERASRPDARKTLTEISDLAQFMADEVGQLPQEFVDNYNRDMAASCTDMVDLNCFLDSWVAQLTEGLGESALAVAVADCHKLTAADQDRLRTFAKTADEAFLKFNHLPMEVTWAIVLMEQYVSRSDLLTMQTPAVTSIQLMLKHLSDISYIAAEVERAVRGPRSDTPQMLAVQSLAGLFRQTTGNQPTHTSHDRKNYVGSPGSPFGRMVDRFMKIADPDNYSRRGVMEALEYVCWSDRPARRRVGIGRQQAVRERHILAAIKERGLVTNFPRPDH